jgi:hypothetical protein
VDPLASIARALGERSVRYVVIGVAAANYYAHAGAAVFTTKDLDLFLPVDPDNLLQCWSACESMGLDLLSGNEALDRPRDRRLAERVIAQRAAVRGTDRAELEIDLTLVMAGFDFDTVWGQRREFIVDGIRIPVARLLHIVESKHSAGRDKDRLFLATHREALQDLLRRDENEGR